MSSGDQDIDAVLRSQDFYRLKQELQSSGDIFEVDVGTKAIYLGPESDISEVQIMYYNPDEPLSLETATVSVNGPFIGRIDTLLKTEVSSTGQPARILVSPVDLVNTAYVNPSTNPYRRYNLPTLIDLFFALQPLPEVPAVRPDRTIRLPQVPWSPSAVGMTDGSTDLYIPIYGRRMVSVQSFATGGVGGELEFSLVSLLPPSGGTDVVPRVIGTTVSPGRIQKATVIRASDAARFGITYDPANSETGRYVESDQPSNLVVTTTGTSGVPRGIADLLCINISGGSGNLLFMDLVIQMSDREN